MRVGDGTGTGGETSISQNQVFIATEGDRYFDRNHDHYSGADMSRDMPVDMLNIFGIRPGSVLEVGAANGFRVAHLVDTGAAGRAVAVDPSTLALADGSSRFPRVKFVRADAAALPLVGAFDLVIVHFVLHWLAPETLPAAVADISRLVADDGLLLLGDFFPDRPSSEPYHHLPGIYTYKQDYSRLFTAEGSFACAGFLTGSHSTAWWSATAEGRDRTAVWLLRKLGRPPDQSGRPKRRRDGTTR